MSYYDESTDQKISQLSRTHPELAKFMAEELVQNFPDHRRSWAALAYVYEMARDFRKAIECLEKSAELAPMEPVCDFNIGRMYLDLREFDKASYFFSECMRKSLENGDDYYMYASRFLKIYCLCMIGDYRIAIDEIELVRDYDCWWIDGLITKSYLEKMCKYKQL